MVGALGNTFTTAEALGSGVHRRELYSLRDDGSLIELSRGVFRWADAPVPTFPDLLAVSRRVPVAIVCCVSAAAVYDLTDEIPIAVQFAVPRQHRSPRIDHPPTEVFRFTAERFELGLSSVEAAIGEFVRIYNRERTVADLMRLRNRLGEPLALAALRRYLHSRDARPRDLLAVARELNILGPVRTAMDAVTAE
ncbi:type IV toxin-antitoxin system AbiEi family antitoxin domain-containing protein [Lentzea alba]